MGALKRKTDRSVPEAVFGKGRGTEPATGDGRGYTIHCFGGNSNGESINSPLDCCPAHDLTLDLPEIN